MYRDTWICQTCVREGFRAARPHAGRGSRGGFDTAGRMDTNGDNGSVQGNIWDGERHPWTSVPWGMKEWEQGCVVRSRGAVKGRAWVPRRGVDTLGHKGAQTETTGAFRETYGTEKDIHGRVFLGV